MRHVMVRYRIKPEHVAENERLVRAVYDELHRVDPAGLRYATFRLDDGVSFVHLATLEADDGTSPLSDLQAFDEFQRDLDSRCDDRPVLTKMHEVGSFGVFDQKEPSR